MDLVGPDIFNRDPRDHYDLLQRLGGGTYGEVFKVRKPSCLHHLNPLIFGVRPKKGNGCKKTPVLDHSSGMLRDSGKWSLLDGQLPLYKARDKVSGDLVALKMVKMEPGERGPWNSFPAPTPTSWDLGTTSP
jgi:hypothetical protein